ncbi:hypothetical protein TorRG33x02_149010, partial [Trema orientale]
MACPAASSPSFVALAASSPYLQGEFVPIHILIEEAAVLMFYLTVSPYNGHVLDRNEMEIRKCFLFLLIYVFIYPFGHKFWEILKLGRDDSIFDSFSIPKSFP